MIASAGDELFDVSGHGLIIGSPNRVVANGIFDVFDARDRGCELSAEVDRHLQIRLAVQHEGRHLQRRQDRGDVYLAVEL